MRYITTTKKEGFAMLFTVLIMSLILAIAVGISNTTFKQTILSSLAKDSQSAFYQADAAMECALYYDLTKGYFPQDIAFDQIPLTLPCGNQMLAFDAQKSAQNYFFYVQTTTDQSKGCFGILFNKTDPVISVIQAKGYSVCQDSPRKVERVLEVKYSGADIEPTPPPTDGGGTLSPIDNTNKKEVPGLGTDNLQSE